MHGEAVNWVFVAMMVFVFVSIMRGGRLGRRHRRLQQEVETLRSSYASPPPALPGASREQLERLEDRVRVLERIVTDRGSLLAAEIEALRDRPTARAAELDEQRELSRN